jgi:dUTP pyrophosphatase
MRDKLARLEHLDAEMAGDSVADACVDLANYAFIFGALADGSWHDGASAAPRLSRRVATAVGRIDTPAKMGDVGYDLHAVETTTCRSGRITPVHTGARVLPPSGVWYRIAGRSSLSKRGCWVMDNVIDCEYTGELVAMVYNSTENPVVFEEGERIAQVVFFEAIWPEIKRVEALPPTERGDSGWGSTGK